MSGTTFTTHTSYTSHALHATLVTPFDPGTGAVLLDELTAMARRLADASARSSVPLVPIINAEAGEIYTLSREERTANLEAVVGAGLGPVVGGVVGRTTAEAVEVAKEAVAAGAQALFVLPPFGSGDITTSWDPVRYPRVVSEYTGRIADAVGDVPLVIHPSGPRSPAYGIGWPLETVRAVIGRAPTVAGWKMTYSYEGYRRVARYLRAHAPQVAVLPSSAVRYHENLANRQLDGACSGSFCYALDPMVEHIELWRKGEVSAATDLWLDGLAELHEYVYSDYARLHIRYKVAAWLAGEISSPLMRDPMPEPERAEADRLCALLTGAGLAARDAAEVDAFFAAHVHA
ncbi:dihydrodipicolinate synthase family protein [Streptomyces sp. NPDC050560]|uniref:dihydrodipicolinate synthase family protein n=1 Tax=Streptomyces sp. NPDC050560 TaxID=3365630 RepID=UPI0037A26B2A